jgi:protein-L-isoaspartate(D-aspartate) O-methyltransferase
VLQVGAGTGYFTAVMARCIGAGGRVVAYEVDAALAGRAGENLAALSRTSSDLPAIEVRHGDATTVGGPFDAILVNAGTTHPLDAWLDALSPRGRIVVPLTCAFAAGPITKGIVVLITREHSAFAAQTVGFVAIYAAAAVRDEGINAKIGAALRANPLPRLAALRRDAHDQSPRCWLHTGRFCLEQQEGPPPAAAARAQRGGEGGASSAPTEDNGTHP